MSLLSFLGRGRAKAPAYPADTLRTHDGTPLTFTFFGHASLGIATDTLTIYVDPVGDFGDFASQPKADLVLVTHSHDDHFDRAAVEALETTGTELLCDRTTAEAFDMECRLMRPGSVARPRQGVEIEAVAAYNVTPDRKGFHPREREDCGYVLTLGGTRIYVAGDTEPTPEMQALRDIDIAFLPVNQPYTMTVGQAVEAVRVLRPKIFYPYHYGQVEERTDLERLVREVEALGTTEIRVRPME